jgi:hypothetical protein
MHAVKQRHVHSGCRTFATRLNGDTLSYNIGLEWRNVASYLRKHLSITTTEFAKDFTSLLKKNEHEKAAAKNR